MRCQVSIWRWSPFLGICLSKSTVTARCTTYGANDVVSAVDGSLRRCQWASRLSPRQVRRPMPVIHTSRGSAMGKRLHGKLDFGRDLLHAGAERRIREFNKPECQFRVADPLALALDVCLGHREA